MLRRLLRARLATSDGEHTACGIKRTTRLRRVPLDFHRTSRGSADGVRMRFLGRSFVQDDDTMQSGINDR
jgi:hypothetical protein